MHLFLVRCRTSSAIVVVPAREYDSRSRFCERPAIRANPGGDVRARLVYAKWFRYYYQLKVTDGHL